MTENAKDTRVNIIPGLRYHDAPAAIEWLCEAFGFEKHLVVPAGEGLIAHAQLTFGNGMIMLGSARGGEFDHLVKPPSDLGGGCTQSSYVVVEDVDAHHARAAAAGAEVVMAPHDEDFGGRGYACRDLEGNVWYFGSYDPWSSG